MKAEVVIQDKLKFVVPVVISFGTLLVNWIDGGVLDRAELSNFVQLLFLCIVVYLTPAPGYLPPIPPYDETSEKRDRSSRRSRRKRHEQRDRIVPFGDPDESLHPDLFPQEFGDVDLRRENRRDTSEEDTQPLGALRWDKTGWTKDQG